MVNYPMTFTATAQAQPGMDSRWLTTTADERSIECSIPKEFLGPNTGFSPEDLFILALMNCYIATLKVIANNSKMDFTSLHGQAKLSLDRDTPSSAPWMIRADLKFVASGVENKDRFHRLMERVSKQCMIINSVKTEIHFTFEVGTIS